MCSDDILLARDIVEMLAIEKGSVFTPNIDSEGKRSLLQLFKILLYEKEFKALRNYPNPSAESPHPKINQPQSQKSRSYPPA
jgi:hypothetical protein